MGSGLVLKGSGFTSLGFRAYRHPEVPTFLGILASKYRVRAWLRV